jgi:phospholipid/cholesterol/gamma-HCH transport system substrate-binding protein
LSRRNVFRHAVTVLLTTVALTAVSSCSALRDFHGANSLPLPGKTGVGAGAYTIQVQMPDALNLKENARVQYKDVLVGNVSKIQRQGWHALVTVSLDPSADIPANATATIGQTSLLGTLHLEFNEPEGVSPKGKLHQGSVIPLSAAGAYPSTEQTLGALSLILNGGGLGQVEDITRALSVATSGREQDLKSLIVQLDKFTAYLDDQKDDIISAFDNFNNLVGQLGDQKPVLDRALTSIPKGLKVLDEERTALSDALRAFGPQLSQLTSDILDTTKDNLIKELNDVGPVLKSLADSGLALTRGLDYLSVPLFSKPNTSKWIKGEYGNLTGIFDLTLSRIDSSLFVGSRWEGNLTELEMQWGRTLGVTPSPYTARNPLVAPYQFQQGP